MSFWWLSFCDAENESGAQFLGACIVQADTPQEAIESAWKHGCNPGGEVLVQEIPSSYAARFGTNTLLSKQQIQRLDTTH